MVVGHGVVGPLVEGRTPHSYKLSDSLTLGMFGNFENKL